MKRSLLTPLACAFAIVSTAIWSGPAAAEEPFLVKDIDTTGEPVCITNPTGTCAWLFGSFPHQLMRLGDRIVFVADDRSHGFEPWVSDGSEEGTRLLADLCPGECGSGPVLLGRMGPDIVFAARAEESQVSCGLWRTDGDIAESIGRAPLDGLCLRENASPLEAFLGRPVTAPTASVGGELFFSHRFSSIAWGLSRTDGTAIGTERVATLCGVGHAGYCSVRVQAMTAAGERLFYVTGIEGRTRPVPRLWRLDPSAGAPEVVARSRARAGQAFTDLTVVGDELFFVGSTVEGVEASNDGRHLFRVGAEGGAELVRAFPGLTDTHVPAGPGHPVLVAGAVVFPVWDGEETTVWRSDGTRAGTVPLFPDVRVPGPHSLHRLGTGFLLAQLRERSQRSPLALRALSSAGEVTVLGEFAGDDRSGRGPSLGAIRVVGDRAFFSAWTPEHGTELWTTDGSPEGTRRLGDLAPGPEGSVPRTLTPAEDLLFFAAEHGAFDTLSGYDPPPPPPGVGRELWALRLDGRDGPPPPPGDWLAPPALDGFRLQVRITATDSVPGRLEPSCQPETACVSGALPWRSEVFVRVLGPRPNGYLWPTIVRFTPSRVEVWLEQIETGEVVYYDLPSVPPGEPDLSGRQDRTGFLP